MKKTSSKTARPRSRSASDLEQLRQEVWRVQRQLLEAEIREMKHDASVYRRSVGDLVSSWPTVKSSDPIAYPWMDWCADTAEAVAGALRSSMVGCVKEGSEPSAYARGMLNKAAAILLRLAHQFPPDKDYSCVPLPAPIERAQ